MTRYSVQTKDRIFVEGYGFLSFSENAGKIFGTNIRKKLSSKKSQKLPDRAKKSATDALKTASKRAIRKTAEPTSDLTGDKIADKVSNISPRDNSETNKEEEILRERYIPPEQRQKFIDDLRLT